MPLRRRFTPPPAAEQSDRRPLENLQELPRAASISHFRSAIDRAGQSFTGKFPMLRNFGPAAYWEYITTYATHVFRRKVRFPDASHAPHRSIYRDLRPSLHFGVAGDWATGTDESYVAARGLSQGHPDYTIHLGDVYFIGDKAEVYTNFLGLTSDHYRKGYQTVRWPLGRRGAFSLNGNHEMYANGAGYFHHLLPAIGVIPEAAAPEAGHQAVPEAIPKAGHQARPLGQGCSFFCLELERWLIVAVDTGYNSRGLPFVSQLDPIHIGWVHRLQDWLKPSCRLPGPLMDWLRTEVRPLLRDEQGRARGVILLSHHQYFSAFPEEFAFPQPAAQIYDALGIDAAIWFWGHEHRFAGYDFGGPGALKVHARCMGHGGMPVSTVETVPPRPEGSPEDGDAWTPALRFFDNRAYQTNPDGSVFGWNGYMKLEVAGESVKASYFDIASILAPGSVDEYADRDYQDSLLLREHFTLEADGRIACETEQLCLDKDFYGPRKWG